MDSVTRHFVESVLFFWWFQEKILWLILCLLHVQTAGFLCKTKNRCQSNIQYYNMYWFYNYLRNLFPGLSRKTRISDSIFFFYIPAMEKVALKKLSLPIYLWSLNFQQKSTRAKNPFYCSQLLLQVLVLLHLLLKFEMQICANTVIYSAVFLIISII